MVRDSTILVLPAFSRFAKAPARTQRRKMTKHPSVSGVKIGTHNGTFHCDEVLACYMLKCLPRYKDAEIVRSRDEAVLAACDVVVDVGGVYDPATHRYDHHQKGFDATMNSLAPSFPWTTKLSSAGLVYYHFGRDILKNLTKSEDENMLDNVYRRIYDSFIQEMDGIDNGVPMFDGEPKYRISTNLSARVGHLNVQWNSSDRNETERFYSALDLVGKEFEERVSHGVNVWWPARDIVQQAIDGRYSVDDSGEIMELPDGQFCPWKEHYFDLHRKMNLQPGVKFVLFKDRCGWRVQAVPVEAGSFVCHVFLAEEWRGLSKEDLVATSGIEGIAFVHATGFIGGNATREGALQMAVRSLQNRDRMNVKEG